MNYMFVGDTHGDLDFVEQVAGLAADYSAEIIQVGDWGFMWPGRDKIDELHDLLRKYGVTMRFIDGNHDDHPRLKEFANRPNQDTDNYPNLIYQPRGSMHEDKDGKRFLFMGGAPSIDKEFRREGRSWWPEEEITDEQMEKALAHENIDVIVTHDAPWFPPGYGPKGPIEYQTKAWESQQRLNKLVKHYKPDLLVHGHWHFRYTGQMGTTAIIGLDCNNAKLNLAFHHYRP